jgi:NADPH-dependent 2,4-dienoyl-CoA reductase/sulfur reductase-like enzyme
MRRYVIVGSGAAGFAAAQILRQRDPSGQVCLVTADRHGYYSRPGLAYYLEGEIPESQLYPFSREEIRRMEIQWLNDPAEGLYPGQHLLRLKSGCRIAYDRLLLAMGASALLPEVTGTSLQGVVRLDTLEDANHILQLVRRGQPAVVVGGGITALELAEGLAARGMKVHYFLRGERYWSGVLDERESRLVEERLCSSGVILHFNTQLQEIYGRSGRVEGVRAKTEDQVVQIPCRMVAVAVGIRPRKTLAEAAGIDCRRGVLTGVDLATSQPDIYAAGDLAEVFDPESQQHTLTSLWGPAIAMGQVAGENMVGLSRDYYPMPPLNVTRLGGLVTTIIGRVNPQENTTKPDRDLSGIMRGDSEIWRHNPEAVLAHNHGGGNRLRLYLRQNWLVGALLMGDQTLSQPLQTLITRRVDLQEVRPHLLAPGAPLPELIARFWSQYVAQSA